MQVNIDEYQKSKEGIVKAYKSWGTNRAIEVAVLSAIPLIAAYIFLNEEFGGFDEDIERLTKFYRYTEIVRSEK